MKPKKRNKKLSLNKSTISRLNKKEMFLAKAGWVYTVDTPCDDHGIPENGATLWCYTEIPCTKDTSQYC